MADEVITEQVAPEAAPQTEQVETSSKPRAVKAKAKVVEDAPAEVDHPKPDPMMAELVRHQRELADMRKELESHRARVKQFERDQKKQSVLAALIDEFPGISRNEIRGAALVAAEDGEVDLYSDDHQAVVDRLKEALRPKAKKASNSSPPASLGGTPGSPSKPPAANRKFLI